MRVSPNKLGLLTGGFFAFLGLMWSGAVAIEVAKPLADAMLRMHMIKDAFTILPFSFPNMLMLVVVMFLKGYLLGWLLARALAWSEK